MSSDGTVLAENHDDVGLDPRLAFTCTESGTYVVRLFAFPSTLGQRIYFHGEESYVYRLTLTTGPYITHAVPMSISLCDADALEPKTVEVFGWNIPRGTRLPVVPLGVCGGPWSSFAPRTKRPDRRVADFCALSMLNAYWRQAEIETNEIARSPLSGIGLVRSPGWTGTTRVRLVPHGVTGVMADTSEDRPLRLKAPNAITGCIRKPRHTDFFRLPTKKDQQLKIAVESVSLDSPLVPLVQLRDPDGKIAAEVRLLRRDGQTIKITPATMSISVSNRQ